MIIVCILLTIISNILGHFQLICDHLSYIGWNKYISRRSYLGAQKSFCWEHKKKSIRHVPQLSRKGLNCFYAICRIIYPLRNWDGAIGSGDTRTCSDNAHIASSSNAASISVLYHKSAEIPISAEMRLHTAPSRRASRADTRTR